MISEYDTYVSLRIPRHLKDKLENAVILTGSKSKSEFIREILESEVNRIVEGG